MPASSPPELNWKCRIMQVPAWIHKPAVFSNHSRLKIVPHTDLFPERTVQRQEGMIIPLYLPTFNSRAIESRLGTLPDAASTVVYLNDDFYVGHTLVPSDFATLLYGPVFRLDGRKWLQGASGERVTSFSSETRSRNTRMTSALLDKRFGKRERSQLIHVAYTVPSELAQEASLTWDRELEQVRV